MKRSLPRQQIDYFIGILGVTNPHIISPYGKIGGFDPESWDTFEHTPDDKETAYQIAWLLSGMAEEDEHGDVKLVGGDSYENMKCMTTSFAWMISLRAGSLFNMLYDEHSKVF